MLTVLPLLDELVQGAKLISEGTSHFQFTLNTLGKNMGHISHEIPPFARPREFPWNSANFQH